MKLLTRHEAAALLGVGIATLDRMRYAGEISQVRVRSRGVRIPEEEIQRYEETHAEQGGKETATVLEMK